jgi:hypothetical protein
MEIMGVRDQQCLAERGESEQGPWAALVQAGPHIFNTVSRRRSIVSSGILSKKQQQRQAPFHSPLEPLAVKQARRAAYRATGAGLSRVRTVSADQRC